MKILLQLLYVLLFLVVIILLAGLILPDYHAIKQQTTIRAQPGLVYEQLYNIENWKSWAPWLIKDSSAEVSPGTITEGEGSSFSWKSRKYGSGSMKITSCKKNEFVKGTMSFGKFGTAEFKITLAKKGTQTLAKYEVIFKDIGYFERYFVYFMDDQLDAAYQEGLMKLKEKAEDLRMSRMSAPAFENHSTMQLLAVTDTVKGDYLKDRYQVNLEKIKSRLALRKIEPAGEPIIIYFRNSTAGEKLFASAVPISKRTWSRNEYQYLTIDTGKVATITHWGDYSRPDPYTTLDAFMKNKLVKTDTFWWEQFVINPVIDVDTGEWQRKIFYPLITE